MGRAPCCSKVGLNKGPWTAEEDMLLMKYIEQHGEGNWRALPKAAGLLRCGKSCRLRWINYLRPDLKRGNISEDEEDLIILLHALLGNRWSLIAGRIPGRTDNEIKNYWNTHLSKKLTSMRTNPATHKRLYCSRNTLHSRKQNALLAEKTEIIQKQKLMESHLVSIDSSDLESNNTQNTQPSSLIKGPPHIISAESLMWPSEQPLQDLKLPNIYRFCGDVTPRSLQSSATTISSSFMLESDSDSASLDQTAFSGNLSWPLPDNDLTSFEIEPSSGFSSQKSISNSLTFDSAYNPSSDMLHKAYVPSSELVLHKSKHMDHTVYHLFGKEGLVQDDFSDSANDTTETARPDTSTETSNAHTLPDLGFLDELEVDALWDCLTIDPLTNNSSNSDTIEGNDSNVDTVEASGSYWEEFFMETDPGCIWMSDKSHVQPW
ncbi:hypothetical protein O6H91_16G065500 [Diphasiastrum complanatum]|uniref:Uncharacterized protein n=1 Tax=Diphasiastrum complanatum TaxID=34168 RepID=A0ACC2BD63_DIPCM|nr:hypothetical protein O6H91_16G065500 [Diphasiastrum complanatum]